MPALSLNTLSLAAPNVVRPRFDPARLGVGIVHLGIGAFHRAHQAVYTYDAIASARGDWGICGVSLRSPGVRDQMAPQDGLYTSVERSPEGIRRRIVGSVREVLFLGDARERIRKHLAAPTTHIVTLTVTEKGYCHHPASGQLNLSHPDIVHDLAAPEAPVTVVGLLAAALHDRFVSHGAPLTIVCCDNLPDNGALVHGLVHTYAERLRPALAAWIGDHAAFPSTMVDRIVPATTAADVAENDAAIALADAAPVVHEPFIQWVIEDDFASPRPRWEAGGAQFVADVAPFEAMKLRLLNATHSAFAYLGFLAGYEYIYQVAAQTDFVAYMRRFMEREATPTLTVPADVDVAGYREALVKRYRNPALPHRTQQIAMDGSQKLPQRILGTVRDNLARRRAIDCAALAVAAWMRYVSGEDEQHRPIKVSDPMAPQFAAIASAHRGDASQLATSLLALRPIFGDDLPADPRFTAPVTRALAQLLTDGAARTVAALVRNP